MMPRWNLQLFGSHHARRGRAGAGRMEYQLAAPLLVDVQRMESEKLRIGPVVRVLAKEPGRGGMLHEVSFASRCGRGLRPMHSGSDRIMA